LRTASKQILEMFSKGGAEVDQKDQHLVEESLRKAPKQMLCGRNPKYDILLEDSRVYFGLGGTLSIRF
jgi:trimethylamine:corrinoid methyltransferase-like protein